MIIHVCLTCLMGCASQPQILSDLAGGGRLINEQSIRLRECEKELDPAMAMRCKDRATSGRVVEKQNFRIETSAPDEVKQVTPQ
jgi:hypothetical protein